MSESMAKDFRPLASRGLGFHGSPREARRAMQILDSNGKVNDGSDPSTNAELLVPVATTSNFLSGDTLNCSKRSIRGDSCLANAWTVRARHLFSFDLLMNVVFDG